MQAETSIADASYDSDLAAVHLARQSGVEPKMSCHKTEVLGGSQRQGSATTSPRNAVPHPNGLFEFFL